MSDRVFCPHCGAKVGTDAGACPACGRNLTDSAPSLSMSAASAATGPHAAGPRLDAGRNMGPYRLERLLGRGGFAEVWEAENGETGRRVALKVLTELRAESSTALERFQQEGRLAASLSHHRCVYVFGAAELDGYPVISMELMDGGTLAERLKEGPLPVEEAVDYVMDVLDGLEAGHQAGIIHRDVKPSNCFLDRDGGAKIGDFGISKSLESDAGLTATGSFLGTPYYAAPEQVSGEPLDFRADMYSVGAMLYELLTGRPPFGGQTAAQVLAQVMTKPPTPFAEHRANVPKGLQRVVLKLLEKEPAKRYPSYQALRTALTPFSSRGFTPAPLLRRFGAVATDFLLFLPLGMLTGATVFSSGLRASAVGSLTILAVQALYFWLMEGLLGWTLGKRLMRLRVASAGGGVATPKSVLVRTLVFLGIYSAPNVAMSVAMLAGVNVVGMNPWQWLPTLGVLVAVGVLISTMRRANGFTALHEVVSGTRTVTALEQERPLGAPRDVPLPVLDAAGDQRLGPYRVTGTIWERTGEALLRAHDDELGRDVWIHVFHDPSVAPPLERLHGRRAGSLPWLQRSTGDGVQWDAYGAPGGAGLVRWVESAGGLTWRELRDVSLSLSRELAARFSADRTAGPLSLQHVWVDEWGESLLLDFPLDPDGTGAGETREVTEAEGLPFLRDVVTFGFTGTPLPAGEIPRVPMPEHARTLVARLSGHGKPIASAGEFAQLLGKTKDYAVEVTQLRRLGTLGPPAVVPLLALLLVTLLPMLLARVPAWYRDLAMNWDNYAEELARIDSTEATGRTLEAADARTREAIYTVLSAARESTTANPEIGQLLLGEMPAARRALLDTAAIHRPHPTTEALEGARAWLASRGSADMADVFGWRQIPQVLLGSFFVLGFFGIGGPLTALLFRGPVILQAAGISIQRLDGSPASRGRCFIRSLVAWSPLLMLMFASVVLDLDVDELGAALAIVTVQLVGVAWSVFVPARGPADRVAGTVLVPK